ncbi:MAG: hypothetical protein ACUZ8O_04185 [Candidatus Anammoxibacter sp.]
MKFKGIWHIQEMEMWEADYFNEGVKAYVKIKSDGMGDFQFGYVQGQIDGEVFKEESDEKLIFSWEGNDESDLATGAGWLKLKDKNTLEGWIKFHCGESSGFLAKRAK